MEVFQVSIKDGARKVSGKGEERGRRFNISLVLGHQQSCNPPAKYRDQSSL